MSTPTATDPLKARHRAMWASGDYATTAAEIIPGLGAELVDACAVTSGQRVLDVAAGSGNAAIPAALRGARVVACDLTPELLAAGQRIAAERGAALEWCEGDAESLPFGDASFDTVLSCLGVMFAPHHRSAAGELVRVCAPGGTIGLISWTPRGFLGQLLGAMKPYVPAPPPGASPPPLWGDEDYVRGLFGDAVGEIDAARRTVPVTRFGSGQEFVDYFKTMYGPVLMAYRGLADDPDRAAALDTDLVALADDAGAAAGRMDWEYLLLTAHRR